jgi:hypothetical protein
MVHVYEKKNRFMVFRWPEDRTVYRQGVRSPVASKSASQRWGEERERALLRAGKHARPQRSEAQSATAPARRYLR